MRDQESPAATDSAYLQATTTIVVAYLGCSSLPLYQISDVINTVHDALRRIDSPSADDTAAPPVPAVSIRKSITPDFLVCLEDGLQFKLLKRHLRTQYGMTPDAYRAKWNLPASYPMVAPNYSAERSEQAKRFGLGKPRRRGRGKAAGRRT